MQKRWLLAVLVLGILFWRQDVLADDPAYKAENSFEALQLNTLSIQRFDVLLRSTELADMEDLGFTESETLIRLARDDTKQRALELRFRKQAQIVLDEAGKSGSSNSDKLQAKLIDQGLYTSRVWPNVALKKSVDDFENALLSADFLHLDFIGATHFPTRDQHFNSQVKNARVAKEKMWVILKAGVARPNRTIVSNDEVIFSWEFPPADNYPFAAGSKLICDRKTLLPKSRLIWGGEGEQRKELQTITYTWTEKAGVVVPLTVTSKKRDYELAPDKTKIEFDKISTFKFHWFSVNSDLDERLFNGKSVDDPEEVRRLTDPQATGAKDLLE